MGDIKPIRPEQVTDLKAELIPDGVIQAFNELIAENWRGGFGGSSNFKQDVVMTRILRFMLELPQLFPSDVAELKRSDIYAKKWLDVEPLYRAEGWEVDFDKPAYNESYDANFTFRRKK